MKNLVDAREFDAFKKKVLDPGILTEYEVFLHGSLLERDGELAYFKIPPQTAVVMFNLPGYLTTMYVKKDILSADLMAVTESAYPRDDFSRLRAYPGIAVGFW